MGLFDSIPIRSNGAEGGEVDASWWNSIRTALINAFGESITSETDFTIADDESSLTDITGLSVDSSEVVYAKVVYTISRTDGSTPRRETGALFLTYDDNGSSWELDRRSNFGDALNMGNNSISVTAGGQLQYKSDSMGGSYVGSMKYRITESLTA
jgi:hypothetical protein